MSAPKTIDNPYTNERARQRARARAQEAAKNAPGISFFAVFGFILISVMLMFVVLAQISYNDTTRENARLNAQLAALTEQHRRLEINFESVFDMSEVERYARDVLGMTRPLQSQAQIVVSAPADRAEVLAPPDSGGIRGFGEFLSSLLGYFR